MSTICAIIARQRHEALFEEMDQAADRGAKLLEIRLDYLRNEPQLSEIIERRRCPLIATIRRREDGGKWPGSEEHRVAVLKGAILAGFDYVDLEDDIAGSVARFGSTLRIVSHHDFRRIPSDLAALAERMARMDADVVKIAGMGHKATDNFKMLKLAANASFPVVPICMGEFGLASRVLAGKVGAPFTYAAFNADRVVAPGLLTFDEMDLLYRAGNVTEKTEVFGVIGDPIGHSLSPLVHNTAFDELGMDRVYVPFHVTAANLEKFMDRMPAAGIRGLSVTIPHKELVGHWGDSADRLSLLTGSANTVIVQPDESIEIHNTDGPAAINSLLANLTPTDGEDPTVEGRSALVLGAGGVAKTLAFCLHEAGAIVTIANRTLLKAQTLAKTIGCKFVDWAQRETVAADIIINGTSVGMHPNVEESPYSAGSIRAGMVFFDTVYNPRMTRLLQDAEERDARVITGVDMFVAQAEAQFEIFTGRQPPEGLMKELVEEELSPARKMLREARWARRKKSS